MQSKSLFETEFYYFFQSPKFLYNQLRILDEANINKQWANGHINSFNVTLYLAINFAISQSLAPLVPSTNLIFFLKFIEQQTVENYNVIFRSECRLVSRTNSVFAS